MSVLNFCNSCRVPRCEKMDLKIIQSLESVQINKNAGKPKNFGT